MTQFSKKYGIRAVLFLSLTLIFINAHASSAASSGISDDAYINQLISRANALQLHNDPYWKLLLHYKRGIAGDRSLVDDPKFFLAPNGRRKPGAELEATLRSFFAVHSDPNTKHPALRFPARYFWLREQLNIDKARVPVDVDRFYQDLTARFDPKRAILVFPSGYMDSPASMFGHTLLLLENTKGDKLTSMAVNYSARTEETFGPSFAIKGLLGLYEGYFSFLAYYEKINEYSNTDMRDIWEYYLNLDDRELHRLIAHMIELENIYSDYYFIDENCSYNLLFLLEAARPSSKLTSGFTFTAEPIATIQSVLRSGMVSESQFRPSLYSRITISRSLLTDEEQDSLYRFSTGKSPELHLPPDNQERQALLLESTSEYLQFLVARGEITQKEYSSRFFQVLKLRRTLATDSGINYQAYQPSRPETILPSRKITIEGGRYRDQNFISASFRVNYHEMMDLDNGVTEHSTIVFAKTEGRYFVEDEHVQLQRFYLFDIFSLPITNRFHSFNCWRIRTGLEQMETPDGGTELAGIIHGGAGRSFESPIGRLYFFFEPEVNFNTAYEYNCLNTVAAKAGLISTPFSIWKSHIYGRIGHSVFGDRTPVYEAVTEQRLHLGSATALSGQYRIRSLFHKTIHEFAVSASLYF